METHRLQKAAVDLHTAGRVQAKEARHLIHLVQALLANQIMVVRLLATTMVLHLAANLVIQLLAMGHLLRQKVIRVRRLLTMVDHRLTISTMLPR